jgi:ADP-ribosyl-[dinitrogen reductase] hydrolase
MVKTSRTHPLRIDCVTPPGTTGTIGMTLCPGRKGSSRDGGGSWDRDLGLDLEIVRTWKPDIVIALLEPFEYAPLGIPTFQQTVIEAGLPWVFLPIRDGGIPDKAFEDEWATVGPTVRAILRRGGNVLIHCRAGLGRTGLLAASLLIDFGAEPRTAIEEIRDLRPGAVETQAQEDYVLSHHPVPTDIDVTRG